jgi:hypothetical protein
MKISCFVYLFSFYSASFIVLLGSEVFHKLVLHSHLIRKLIISLIFFICIIYAVFLLNGIGSVPQIDSF